MTSGFFGYGTEVDTPKVYLSGGFYSDYKKKIRELLPEAEIVDPERNADRFGDLARLSGYFVGWDLDDIRKVDVVIAYQDDYPYVYGMAAEVGYAAALGKPVIYVCTGKRVDLFLAGLSRAIFTEIEAACEFIRQRYVKAKKESSSPDLDIYLGDKTAVPRLLVSSLNLLLKS